MGYAEVSWCNEVQVALKAYGGVSILLR